MNGVLSYVSPLLKSNPLLLAFDEYQGNLLNRQVEAKLRTDTPHRLRNKRGSNNQLRTRRIVRTPEHAQYDDIACDSGNVPGDRKGALTLFLPREQHK